MHGASCAQLSALQHGMSRPVLRECSVVWLTFGLHVAFFMRSSLRDSVVRVVTCGFVAPCSTRSPAYLRRPARGLQVACVWPASCFTIRAVRKSVVCDEATCDDVNGALCA